MNSHDGRLDWSSVNYQVGVSGTLNFRPQKKGDLVAQLRLKESWLLGLQMLWISLLNLAYFCTAIGQRPTLYTAIVFQSPLYFTAVSGREQHFRGEMWLLVYKITPIYPRIWVISQHVQNVQKQTGYRWKHWAPSNTNMTSIFAINIF